jgi:carbon storage regulator
MLVLTRKMGEAIVIDGGFKVNLLEVRGNSARLGIEAPKEVPVMRSELLDRIREATALGIPFRAALNH